MKNIKKEAVKKMSKRVALMCPNCYSLYGPIEIKSTISSELDFDYGVLSDPLVENPDFNIEHENVEFKLSGTCTKCKEYIKRFVLLDKEIASIVQTLNKKGFRTTNSCQGHCDGEIIHTPYIMFEKKYTKEEYLPESWEIEKDEFGYDEGGTVIRPKNQEELSNFKSCIHDLEEWALSDNCKME